MLQDCIVVRRLAGRALEDTVSYEDDVVMEEDQETDNDEQNEMGF